MSERWRPLGRHKRRWKDNIEMDLKDVKWGDINWISIA
jgi:hypothetical protein